MENYVRAKQATDDSIIWCLHFTCWITKVAHTPRIYNTYCFSMLTVVTHSCLSVTF